MIKKIIKYWKKRKLLKRYAERPINPKYFGTVDVNSLLSTQPLQAPVSGSFFHLDFVYGSKNVSGAEVLKNIDRLLEIIEEDKNGKIR